MGHSQFDLVKYAERANKIWNGAYDYIGYKPNKNKHQRHVVIYCHQKDKYGREHGIFEKEQTQ